MSQITFKYGLADIDTEITQMEAKQDSGRVWDYKVRIARNRQRYYDVYFESLDEMEDAATSLISYIRLMRMQEADAELIRQRNNR